MKAFFYGTLMHPKILQRVLDNNGSHLQVCPAILKDFTRHKIKAIKGAVYPAIVPYSLSRFMFDRDLEPEERTVRGTLVSGLTEEEVRLLDVFEGDEYIREVVSVYPLGPLASPYDGPLVDIPAPEIFPSIIIQQPIEANTYIWCMPLSQLRPDRWSFEEFVQHDAWRWENNGVDRRKAMEGTIVRSRL